MARTWWAHPQQETQPEPRDAADWLRANGVTLTAVILIVIQLWLKAALLAHSYFKQDDFRFLDRALASGFSWHYLMWVEAGHLLPVGFAIAWVLARLSLYNWPLAGAVTLGILAAACFAMLAMLRTVFGNRPAILIPLALYLFGPLSLAGFDWWSVSLEVLPLELAIFMTIRAHVRYLRNGRLRSALASAGWLAFGMASMVKGAVVPLLLLALTAAFFMTGRGPGGQPAPRHLAAATVRALTWYWRAWLMYAAVLAGYCAVFFLQLPTSSSQPTAPTSPGQVASFVSSLFSTSLLPGAVGGPWRWWAVGYAQAAPPAALEQLSWVVAAAVVAVSCIYRVRAWRSWAILLGWIVLADIVPVILGRLGTQPGSLLGSQTRYLTDATPILALCVGLAFLPVVGERHPYRFQFPALRPAVTAPPAAADRDGPAKADAASAPGTAPSGPAAMLTGPGRRPVAAQGGGGADGCVHRRLVLVAAEPGSGHQAGRRPGLHRDRADRGGPRAHWHADRERVGSRDRDGSCLLLAAGVHVPGHRRDRARRAGPAPGLDQLAARGDPQPDDLRPAGPAAPGHRGRAVVPAAAPAAPQAAAPRQARPR